MPVLLNKLFATQKTHKVLIILTVISIVIISYYALSGGLLYKINKIYQSSIIKDSGDLSNDQSGTITWKQLTATKITYQNKNSEEIVVPLYSDKLMALNHHQVSIKGFMFPLEASTKQTHFLLSPYTTTCPFCLPAGSTELIDVHSIDPTTVYGRSVTVKGQFELITEQSDLQNGMLYRMNNAEIE